MNYGRNNTLKRRRELYARAAKKRNRVKMRPAKIVLLVFLGIGFLILGGGGVLFRKIIDDSPKITADTIRPSAYTTTAYADDGTTVLGTFVAEGANRVFKSLDTIPVNLQNAFIAVEDSRYREHHGIDMKGITRAFFTGIMSGSFSQGGSTITQQLIKNSVFPNFANETRWQSIVRKIQEIYLAYQVEKIVDKDEILEDYLNTVNLGQNTLGVQAASKRYFAKDVSELTLSECAAIAAITKNPSGYNPITRPEANASRREKVLDDMLNQGYISKEAHDEALADNVYERIQIADSQFEDTFAVNSYFVDEVAKSVIRDLQNELGYSEDYARNALYSGGLKIITTQNVAMQQICDEELNRAENYPSRVEWTVTGAISVIHADGTQNHYDHNTFEKYVKDQYFKDNGVELEYGTTFASEEKANSMVAQYIETLKYGDEDTVLTNITVSPQPQASFVVMDQHTGQVKAIVGGRGEKTASMTLDRATQSPRQPGSCFKVLSTYVPALDACGNSLATTITDSPFNYADGTPVRNWWRNSYKGAMSIRACIRESANVCTVKKYTEITPALGLKYLMENFSLTTLDKKKDAGQAVCLGGITQGVYNLEMTAAYASIANGGVYTEPIFYTHIYDHDGRLLYENVPDTHVAMKESTAALITSAMRDVVTSGTATGTRLSGYTTAGKSGTTTETKDYWFSGYSPQLTASVWAGYDDNQAMEGISSFHYVIWRKVMQRIHDTMGYEKKGFDMPDSVVRKTLCRSTGLLAGSGCPTVTEYFDKESLPQKTCTKHSAPAPAPEETQAP